jgi:integrase
MLSLATGGRRGEVLGLKWSDVNHETKSVRFRQTKTDQPREVGMNSAAWEALIEFGKVRSITSDLIFPSRKNKWKGSEANKTFPHEDLRDHFQRALKQAGIKGYTWHDLRHQTAKLLYDNDASLGQIGEMLGHSCAQTTKRYANLGPAKVSELTERFSDKLRVSE